MRLKKLKVSGFKSFVDVTDIRLPGNLVGVVGPNGCGKSNVIDAVRWVMGEASAKMLRGDSMTDVIFNGSASRKPVGKASVELIFDNSDGKAVGNFAQFAEISIKRTLSRDGQSSYFLNNIKARRKDVLDLFRGTGLGSRSYSIIEQGMVSRIVEARPDELRAFVEEAAGTSRYKDRRRETETRIKHTRENLDRIEDISNELEKMLRRLQRQSTSARRYKVLKEEERLVDGQLQIMRLQAFDQQLEDQDRLSTEYENKFQAALTSQRDSENALEQLRKHQTERQQANSQVQQQFYGLGAEIKNIEQRIEHLAETRQRQGEEIERLTANREEREQELAADGKRLQEYEQDVAKLTPEIAELDSQLAQASKALAEAEGVLQSWQQDWESFNNASQQPVRQQEVQQSRINQFEQHLKQTEQRQSRLQQEKGSFQQHLSGPGVGDLKKQVAEHDGSLDVKEQEFQQTEQQIQTLRDEISEKRQQSADLKVRQQESVSRLASLQEIQVAALGTDDSELSQWFAERNISDSGRLASRVSVIDGWERAADRVLNGLIGAVCVDDSSVADLERRPAGAVSLLTLRRARLLPPHMHAERLIDKVTAGEFDLNPLLADVYIADNLQQALEMQDSLFGRDCIVTRDGTLLGANWISFASESQLETGVLVREEEIKQLGTRVAAIEIEIENRERQTEQLVQQRTGLETELQGQRGQLNKMRAEKTSLHNQLGREEARMLEAEQRSQQLSNEIRELTQQVLNDREQIKQAQQLFSEAKEQTGTLEEQRDDLLSQRDKLQANITDHRKSVSVLQDSRHQKQLQKQRIKTAMETVREQLGRLQQQFDSTNARLASINESLTSQGDPVEDLRGQLLVLTNQRAEAEKLFSSAQDEMTGIEHQITSQSNNRSRFEQALNEARETLEQHKLKKQEVLVRKQTQVEHIAEAGFDRESLMADLPENCNINDWQQSLDSIQGKIERIGPVNLVAIEEFEEESQRKEYLDKQHADLTEALETLESVIRKIDRETRSRFHETFDKLNAGFNEFFPQLFGGGKADLQLTSDDFLTAGVTVMARPPGKRNSTIHLLSGGEKALTAVALLFSLFRLNPAPFCMLDEVDAPLDDANVDRYCNTLKKLSEVSQIVVITHNKITMEAADMLVGVTMAEPGVSRLVSVDITEAVEMAAQ